MVCGKIVHEDLFENCSSDIGEKSLSLDMFALAFNFDPCAIFFGYLRYVEHTGTAGR